MTALMIASGSGHTDTVKALLLMPCIDVNMQDKVRNSFDRIFSFSDII